LAKRENKKQQLAVLVELEREANALRGPTLEVKAKLLSVTMEKLEVANKYAELAKKPPGPEKSHAWAVVEVQAAWLDHKSAGLEAEAAEMDAQLGEVEINGLSALLALSEAALESQCQKEYNPEDEDLKERYEDAANRLQSDMDELESHRKWQEAKVELGEVARDKAGISQERAATIEKVNGDKSIPEVSLLDAKLADIEEEEALVLDEMYTLHENVLDFNQSHISAKHEKRGWTNTFRDQKRGMGPPISIYGNNCLITSILLRVAGMGPPMSVQGAEARQLEWTTLGEETASQLDRELAHLAEETVIIQSLPEGPEKAAAQREHHALDAIVAAKRKWIEAKKEVLQAFKVRTDLLPYMDI